MIVVEDFQRVDLVDRNLALSMSNGVEMNAISKFFAVSLNSKTDLGSAQKTQVFEPRLISFPHIARL